jgi:reactive chlorine resistance protein C
MTQSHRIGALGVGISRYAIVAFLLLFGAMKFTDAEAQAIRPMVEHHPLMSFLPTLIGVHGTSALIGVVELTAGVLIALRRFRPQLSAIGSLLAAGIFLITTSFMFTTPGAFAPDSYLGGFLMKDLILMAASLYAAAEALHAVEIRDTATAARLQAAT